jgi:hypothetical protein
MPAGPQKGAFDRLALGFLLSLVAPSDGRRGAGLRPVSTWVSRPISAQLPTSGAALKWYPRLEGCALQSKVNESLNSYPNS